MKKNMISMNQLNFSYTEKPFLQNISFDVEEGEIFGFLGPSGAGKSTLQKILTGLLTTYQGEKRNIDELLKEVGLEQHADKKISEYSKGMKSRLNFIKALVHNPDVLFLDEPTSGLDPNNAQIMKDMILKEKKIGLVNL